MKKVTDLHWLRTDSIHINCKRVRKIVLHFQNAHFSYVLALEKKNGRSAQRLLFEGGPIQPGLTSELVCLPSLF